MIIKKLYRRCRYRWWDKERKVFQNTTITEYVGWFLFGFIPIYLIQLDKYEEVDFEESGQGTLTYGIYRDYGHLIRK